MFKIKYLLVSIFLLVGTMILPAQVDTSLLIKEVEISARSIRNNNLGGKKEVILDGETIINSDLTTLIANKGGIYIKSYGSNSLATSSIRGGSAGHSLILWNGIPLQSPTLGLLDLSLIPVQVMDHIDIQKGGNSALWGSGAIGGVINLENKIGSNPFLAADIQFGSFSNLSTGIKLGFGHDGFYAKTKFTHIQSENNFPYASANISPPIEQINAAFTSTNIAQDLYFLLNEKQYIDIHYWWQKSKKEIPPTLTQNFSEAFQEDKANRLIVSWNRTAEKNKTYVKLALLDEQQDYVDPRINLFSENNFTRWFLELGHGIDFNEKHQLLIGITAVETLAKTNGFSEQITETKLGFWVSHQFNLGKLKIQTSLREEMVEFSLIPLTPSIGAVYAFSKEISILGKLSRNYRLATLNDKYWMPGGNASLLPESGWSEELSIQYDKRLENHKIDLEITGFNRTIDNWILWSPSPEFNFWQAQNLTEVWSRGIETAGTYRYQIKRVEFSIKLNYNYIRSTNEVAISLPKLAKGQQLIYTPTHQVGSQFAFSYKNFSLSYQHLFNGENLGINETIAAYHLGNVLASYRTKIKKTDLSIFLNIQNIWNAQYVVVERRPMPGINFQSGIKILINKHK